MKMRFQRIDFIERDRNCNLPTCKLGQNVKNLTSTKGVAEWEAEGRKHWQEKENGKGE